MRRLSNGRASLRPSFECNNLINLELSDPTFKSNMTIMQLPDETIGDIFRLTILISGPAFNGGNDLLDCIALIDISRVCCLWREISLADPTLWTTFCIRLRNPSADTLRKAMFYVDAVLGRSEALPLTCSIVIADLSDLQLAHPFVRALTSHETRWERVQINVTPPSKSIFPRLGRRGSAARFNDAAIIRRNAHPEGTSLESCFVVQHRDACPLSLFNVPSPFRPPYCTAHPAVATLYAKSRGA